MRNFRNILQFATRDIRRYVDIAVLGAASQLAIILTFIGSGPSFDRSKLPPSAFLILFSLITLWPFLVRGRAWRLVSAYDAIRLAKGVTLTTLGFIAVYVTSYFNIHFLQWILFNSLFSLVGLCGVRIARRLVFERKNRKANVTGRRTLILGTGVPACSLAARFTREPALGIRLVGFITDDSKSIGSKIEGVNVLGGIENFEQILTDNQVQELVISQKFPDGARLRDLLQKAHRLGIRPKIMAHLNFGETGHAGVETLREINLSDLLLRPRVDVDLKPTYRLVQGQTVLVTGAGGSIGQELVRQLVRMNPRQILLLDQAEYNLYAIDSEIKEMGLSSQVIPILSDLREVTLLQQLFNLYRPNLVFHAAAYKHVHLVEANANASILNNITSTKNLLDACIKYQVENFVMISSDKAVNPQGIMGATKRACEMLVSHAGEVENRNYCSVRFGNVIGSSGSFIPLLKKQIHNGGPVTITHPDMERYFMLIPEAVSLVLKTASMSQPGDINILKMGEPIKILDVVKSLMTLMGKKQDEVPLIFTGMRPGEKMKEELYLSGNEIQTTHPDIVVLPKGAQLPGIHNSFGESVLTIERIIDLARSGSKDASSLLHQLVESQDQSSLQLSKGDSRGNTKTPQLVA